MMQLVGFSASLDQTNLFKSCTKTLQARSKASGKTYPSSRIFPASNSDEANESNGKDGSKIPTAAFFHKVREVQDNIQRLRQLIVERKKVYIGRINDPNSMTPEQCSVMDQVCE